MAKSNSNLTESEAAEKWCPWARSANALDEQGVSINRVIGGQGRPDQDCMCIGNRCMAWRWVTDDTGRCGRIPKVNR